MLPRAWAALRSLRPDINLLMVIAGCGAMALGERLEAAAVSCRFAVSLALENSTVARARRALLPLHALTPASVRVVEAD